MTRTANLVLTWGVVIGFAFVVSDVLALVIRAALKSLAW